MWDGPHGTDSGPDLPGEWAGLLGACTHDPSAFIFVLMLLCGPSFLFVDRERETVH